MKRNPRKSGLTRYHLLYEDLNFRLPRVKKRKPYAFTRTLTTRRVLVKDLTFIAWAYSSRAVRSLSTYVAKSTTNGLKRIRRAYKARKRRGHLQITIRLTWVKVLIGVGIALSYNHVFAQNKVIVNPKPVAPEFKTYEPIKTEIKPATPVQKVTPKPAPKPTPKPVAPAPTANSQNSCGWNKYMNYILTKESGCRWNARNPSSGAYGVCQALPASKMASAGADYMTNVNTQLKWCDSYAKERYGDWEQAYYFWLRNHWW